MDSLSGVRIDPHEQAELTAEILERAVTLVDKTGPSSKVKIGPYAAQEEPLRDGLESTYRQLAGSADSDEERYALVDRANAVRRWTLR